MDNTINITKAAGHTRLKKLWIKFKFNVQILGIVGGMECTWPKQCYMHSQKLKSSR